MSALYDNKPIIICSTGGFQTTAIHLIRLSGFDNLNFLKGFFSLDPLKVRPRYAHLGSLSNEQGEKLDDILLTFFPEPNSYTGENCLELSVHGNPLNVRRIINFFIKNFNFRSAHSGEFTYRALKNQKLTISQVEGLDLLLNAHNPLMLDQGLSLLNGDLDQLYHNLYKNFVELKASVELAIDFSDDIGVEQADNNLKASLANFDKTLNQLYQKTKHANSSLLSPYIALFGPTNAGKSTLFNFLLNENRSLVSNIEGTTRDYISETIVLDSGNYKLIDTAGLRQTDDLIESAGIEKAIDILRHSFFKIFVISAHQIVNFDFTSLVTMPDLIIVSHSDLYRAEHFEKLPKCSHILFTNLLEGSYLAGPIEPPEKTGPIEPPEKTGPIEPLEKTGPIEPLEKTGPIEPLECYIFELVNNKYLNASLSKPLLLDRHVNLISAIYEKRQKALSLTDRDFSDLGVVDQEVRWLEDDISHLIGLVTPDQLLNHIFSNFCIGK